jgi:DNA-binding NtrC family response regulator
VVSLTNRILLDEVEAGRFRRDLFYRISSIILKIPPLRDRGDDILLIAEHYNRKGSAETGRDLLVLNSDVQEALMAHSWPGNVRELRNTIASLHFLAKSRHVTLADLPREVTLRAQPRQPDQPRPTAPELGSHASLKDAEESLIQQSLVQHRGNMSQTARSLGISRPTLYRKMQAFGITLASGKSDAPARSEAPGRSSGR